jgi:LysM repeat protein
MFRFSLLSAALVFSGFTASAAGLVALPDSIGVEYRSGKMLIRHRVAPGETLYGLARRYRVPVEQIVEANNGQKGALTTGQIVLVPRQRVVMNASDTPRPAAATATAASARALPTDARGNRVYKVEAGQTLFAIARKFNTTPQALAELNGFAPNYNVRLGQTIIIAAGPTRRETPAAPVTREPVVAAAPARPAPARETPVRETPAAPRPEQRSEAPDKPRDKDLAAATQPSAPKEKEEERAPTRASEIVRRVTESGLATSIPNSTTDKYLALHKTAAVGTIMQVRNIMNGQSVYVRVIGPLPDTGENSNILVRLSPRAVQRLATPDARFRVETSYVP